MPTDPPRPDLDVLEQALAGMTTGPFAAELDVFDAADGVVATVSDKGTRMLAILGTDFAVSTEAEWEADPKAARAKSDAAYVAARAGQELRDARGIAVAVNALPGLIAEVRRLRAALGEAADAAAEGNGCECCGGYSIELERKCEAWWSYLAAPARTDEAT